MSPLRTRVLAAVLGTTVAAAAASIAWAAIPDSGGVINGCYEKRTGILRVIDAEAGKKCLSFENPISWSQQGPQGPPGIQGPQGPQGAEGLPGPPGDPIASIEALAGIPCGDGGTVQVESVVQGEINLRCASQSSGPPDAPQLTILELDPSVEAAAREDIEELNTLLEESTAFLPGGPFHLPASILSADVLGFRAASEPRSRLELYVSADCASGTDWRSVLRAELETEIPASVLDLVEFGLDLFVDSFIGDQFLSVPPSGEVEFPILSFGTATTFSMTARAAAGTSDCSNAVTAP